MSVIGDFTIPADAFALDHALSTVPEMTIKADRLASHSTMEVFPFLWATGGDFEIFNQALEDDPMVSTVTIAEETDDEVLYHLEWSEDFCNLINEMIDHHAAIVESTARDEQWHLKLRFAEESMISEFQTHFQKTGHQFEVTFLSHPTEPHQHEYGLTKEQYEALEAAVRSGYFQIPRATSVEELGDLLGISANAVSQRLRRGSETLIRNALNISENDRDGS